MPNANDQTIPYPTSGRPVIPIVGGVVTIPANTDDAAAVALTGNVSVVLRTPPVGYRTLDLILVQDATGGRTVTFTTSVNWIAGSPIVQAAPGARTRVALLWDNGAWFEDPGIGKTQIHKDDFSTSIATWAVNVVGATGTVARVDNARLGGAIRINGLSGVPSYVELVGPWIDVVPGALIFAQRSAICTANSSMNFATQYQYSGLGTGGRATATGFTGEVSEVGGVTQKVPLGISQMRIVSQCFPSNAADSVDFGETTLWKF